MNKIRVYILDDHPMVISGLKTMLLPFQNIEIVGASYSGKELADNLGSTNPDILLLDILLPDTSGKDLVPLIQEQYPRIKIIVLTSLDTPALVSNMLRKGCKGYLLKGIGAHTLAESIQEVYNGKEVLDSAIKDQLVDNLTKFREKNNTPLPILTQREKEVLKLIAQEHTTKDIAELLHISVRTAENHRYSLIKKLEVSNIAGMVKIAIQMGLL